MSTPVLQQLSASQTSPEIPINENFQTLEHQGVYGQRQAAHSGLTWGYYGGMWGGFAVANGTLALTNTADNYVVVNLGTGAISVSTATTNWNDTTNYGKVYKLTCAGAVVTVQEDHRAGPGGVHGGSGAPSGTGAELKGLTFTSDTATITDADPGNGKFKWNNATQASATVLYFDDQTADGASLTTFWAALAATGFMFLQQSDDSSKWQLWKWTATPVDGTGYRKFTVSLMVSGGSIVTGKTVYAWIQSTGATVSVPINAQTGTTYAIVSTDRWKHVTLSNAASIAATIAQAGTTGFEDGYGAYIENIGVGAVTITPATSTINGAATLVLDGGMAAILFSDGANYRAIVIDPAGVVVNAQTGTSYTYVSSDRGKLLTHTNASAIAGTLPQATGAFKAPWFMWVQNRGAGALTITPTTSTIDGAASLVFTTGQGALIASDGTNYFTMRGFSSAGSSLTNFTEALNSSAPNATVPIAQLLANNAATNVDWAITPKGIGAIVRKIADGTTTGGNKCGTGAVDLQRTTSGAATAVASGTDSALVAGTGNTSSSSASGSFVGTNSTSSGSSAVTLGGNACTATQSNAATVGGNSGNATAAGAVTLGGTTLSSSGTSAVTSGNQSTASAAQAIAMGNGPTADAIASLATGVNSRVRTMLGAHAHQGAAALDGVAGSRQRRSCNLQCNLTTNAAVSMTVDGGAAGTTNIPCAPTGTGLAIDGQVAIRDPATGDCGQFRFRAMVKNVAGTVTLAGTPVADAYMGSASLSACTLTAIADNTNKGILVQPTGIAATALKVSFEGTTCEIGG